MLRDIGSMIRLYEVTQLLRYDPFEDHLVLKMKKPLPKKNGTRVHCTDY